MTLIEKIDKVMEAYNDAYTNASTDQEKELINAEYDIIIGSAEQTFESEIESQIQEEEEALKSEQEESEKELESLENDVKEDDISIEDEVDFIKTEKITPAQIRKRYNKNNPNKNSFSTTQIFNFLGGSGKASETKMSNYIYNTIHEIQKRK